MECNFAKCGYYTDGECNICGMGISGEDTFCKYCKDNPNCYYKQLAELKAENDKLKKELGNNKATYEVALSTYNIECGNLLEENKQLWQTLQDIKELAKGLINGSIGGCEDDIGYNLQKIITKAEEE